MNYKFKKGDLVHVRFEEMFSSSFGGTPVYTTAGPGLPVTDRRLNQGEPEYKIKFFSGWWPERNLVEV